MLSIVCLALCCNHVFQYSCVLVLRVRMMFNTAFKYGVKRFVSVVLCGLACVFNVLF